MLFKKFSTDEISSQNQVKSSAQRAIRAKLIESYPWLESSGVIDVLIPKKEQVLVGKLPEHVQLVILHGRPLFFAQRDGPWYPTLRVLHQYPDMMKKLRCDTGAIKFVLQGANIMCPGLTSPGATIHDEVPADTPVAIYGEGKEQAMAVWLAKIDTADMRSINKEFSVGPVWLCPEMPHPACRVTAVQAMAVGLTKMSTADMRSINKGIGVDNLHYLNDGLWKHIDLEH